MNEVTLDYGDPNEMDTQDQGALMAEGDSRRRGEEEELDAEMEDWAKGYDGDMDAFEEVREQKLQELKNEKMGTKFYPLPREEGIEAGANRGVASQVEMEDVDLMGPEEDLPLPETPAPIGGGQDIRYSVLNLAGSPITQCSTSRLFAFITHYGAQPLGLEWINDSSCNIVFNDSSSARLAIEYLCPAISTSYAPLIPLPNDQTLEMAVLSKKQLDDPNGAEGQEEHKEWSEVLLQSLLTPRKAHRIPAKLYNAPERDAAVELSKFQYSINGKGTSQLPEDVPEIYREMEAEDQRKEMMKPEIVNLRKLQGTLWIRWALESMDVKPSKSAKQSKWYQEHGNDAGKEVVTKLLNVGGISDRLELLPANGSSERSSNRSRREDGDYGRNGEMNNRGRGTRQAAMDNLDADLDSWRGNEYATEAAMGLPSRPMQENQRNRGRREVYRGMTMEALDEELDWNQRDRSASPARLQASGNNRPRNEARSNGTVKVKGRGRMKAPSAWEEVDNANTSSMFADSYPERNNQRRGGRQHQSGRPSDQSLEHRMSQSLEQRLRGGNHLLDRMN